MHTVPQISSPSLDEIFIADAAARQLAEEFTLSAP
jgi:hypothetical protein